MAPSASMLFLSYHQLHHGPADAPHDKDGAGGSGFRFDLGNVFFSLGVLAPKRRDAAVHDGKQKQRARRAGGEEEEEEPATLASKFDEAVRLSCWSS
ncbi:hypothetical protein ACQJBY_037329 [Aegilops geniculata]